MSVFLWSTRDVSIANVLNVLILTLGLMEDAEVSSVAILTRIWIRLPALNEPILKTLRVDLDSYRVHCKPRLASNTGRSVGKQKRTGANFI